MGVESENRPQRGQFLLDLQAHSPAMGQKDGGKWTAAVDLQPTIPKPDRLLVVRFAKRITKFDVFFAESSHVFNAADHFFSKRHKRLRAFGCRVKHHARQAVTGRFGQPHVARDHGVENLVAKVLLELVADLLL